MGHNRVVVLIGQSGNRACHRFARYRAVVAYGSESANKSGKVNDAGCSGQSAALNGLLIQRKIRRVVDMHDNDLLGPQIFYIGDTFSGAKPVETIQKQTGTRRIKRVA